MNTSPKETRPIRVFGLTEAELIALRQLAQQKYGKASVSLLAKKLLQNQLTQPENAPPAQSSNNKSSLTQNPIHNQRITLRLPADDRHYLHQLAQARQGSINDAVRDIIQMYIHQHTIPSQADIKVLYQSNTQLSAIGRNINQIARHLNSGDGTSLTQRQLAELTQIITDHTKLVGNIIREHRTRQKS